MLSLVCVHTTYLCGMQKKKKKKPTLFRFLVTSLVSDTHTKRVGLLQTAR